MDLTWRKVVIAIVIFGVVTLFGLSGWSHIKDDSAGLSGGRLRSCPDRPICVCSLATDDRHAIEPIAFEGDMEVAMARLVGVLEEMPRCSVRVVEVAYIHATFTTQYLRFVDDVEFVPSWEDSAIHVRSSSRVGMSDFGTNRARVEEIRAAFEAAK